MNGIAVYFSDYFGVNIDDIDEYGAINISLIMICHCLLIPFCYLIAKKKNIKKSIKR